MRRDRPAGKGLGGSSALPSSLMLPLGFRFDVDAVILDGTAHTAACPPLPPRLPPRARRLAAGETHWAQRCPRECDCAPSFETVLSYRREREAAV
jgi:hypothetical protein